MQLFVLGMLKNRHSNLTAVKEYFEGEQNNDPHRLTPDEIHRTLGGTRVHVPRTPNPLSQEQFVRLQALVDPLQDCEDQGVAMYLQTLNYVYQCVV